MKFTYVALGASLLANLCVAPAFAANLINPTLGGANDVILYDANGTNTFANPNASLTSILAGNASSPGGNVELFASSEQPGSNFNTLTTLSGTLNGTAMTLSSLTAADWDVFGLQWFGQFLTTGLNAQGQAARASLGDATLYSQFVQAGGRQLFSDPNLSYINQDDTTGEVSMGLAGHFNAYSQVASRIPTLSPLLRQDFQASEIVKVLYGDAPAQYLWSFSATPSGLTEVSDGTSHNGNYEVRFQGTLPDHPPASVPEPATVLGLVVMGGLLVATKGKGEREIG
jgi:hypothetical protein